MKIFVIILAAITLTACGILIDYPTRPDVKCATGSIYTSGPHKGHCWIP